MVADIEMLEKKGAAKRIKIPPTPYNNVSINGLEGDQKETMKALWRAVGLILFYARGPRAVIKWPMIKSYVFKHVKSKKDRKLIERVWWRVLPSSVNVDGAKWYLRSIEKRGLGNRIRAIYENRRWKWRTARPIEPY
jgi:hypothetical protein